MQQSKWLLIMCIGAAASFLSVVQINTVWSDANNFNTAWTIISIVTGLVAVYAVYKAAKNS